MHNIYILSRPPTHHFRDRHSHEYHFFSGKHYCHVCLVKTHDDGVHSYDYPIGICHTSYDSIQSVSWAHASQLGILLIWPYPRPYSGQQGLRSKRITSTTTTTTTSRAATCRPRNGSKSTRVCYSMSRPASDSSRANRRKNSNLVTVLNHHVRLLARVNVV